MYIILLGPPGSGKSTYSTKLVEEFGFYHLSIGDILRSKRDHTLIRKYIDRGDFVPISILLEILEESLKVLDSKNVILDGIPRNIEQVELLNSFLKKVKREVNVVIGFSIKESLLIERILNRLVCSNCKALYNSKFIPTIKKDMCNVCGEKVMKREDDTQEIISVRLENYEIQTKPLVSLYKKRNLYKEFDVSKSTNIVWEEIKTFIEEKL